MKSDAGSVKSKRYTDRLATTFEALACGFWALVVWMEVSDTVYESSKELFKSILSSL